MAIDSQGHLYVGNSSVFINLLYSLTTLGSKFPTYLSKLCIFQDQALDLLL